jgi:hypothetical protein
MASVIDSCRYPTVAVNTSTFGVGIVDVQSQHEDRHPKWGRRLRSISGDLTKSKGVRYIRELATVD